MEEKRPLQSISDDALLQRLAELMGQSRRAEADVVAHIAEVDERRLYAREAFPSMFAYCMDVLHLSEAEAYLRILAGRASRKHPVLLTMLADGRLHLTAIVKVAPHLTLANRDLLLERATHRSKRRILELIAEIAPRPDVPVLVRKLPERRTLPIAGPLAALSREDGLGLGPDPRLVLRPDAVPAPESGAGRDEAAVSPRALHSPAADLGDFGVPASPSSAASSASLTAIASRVSASIVEPLSPGRYKVQFTASAELHHKLERLLALMGSRGPDGDLVAVIEQAVTEKLERLEAQRFARTKAPRKDLATTEAETGPELRSTRHIPAAVRRAVRERDGDRCRYVDERCRRCPERNRLQYHHRHPFGLGGDHSISNVQLLCRAHNAYVAECDYGRETMARHRRTSSNASQPLPG
jgi:HNH endonuclease